MNDFDPNAAYKKPEQPQVATYVPHRTPKFKVYNKRNHATNALNAAREGIMYEWKDDQWVEIDRREVQTHCGHCGNEFTKTSWGYRSTWTLYSHPAKPAYKKPEVCDDCYANHFRRDAVVPIPVEHCGLVSRDY